MDQQNSEVVTSMITEYLQALDFTDKEIQVYKCLCKHGLSNVQAISRLTNISRTTIYPIVSKLIQKGLVSKKETRSADMFVANNPGALLSSLLEERAEIIKKESIVKQLIEASLPYFHPKLEYYETTDDVHGLLKQYTPIWINSAAEYDGRVWGYINDDIVRQYRHWFANYLDKQSAKNLHLFIANDVKLSLKNTKLNEAPLKLLPSGLQLQSTILLHGEYITMLIARDKGCCAFQLHDKSFARDLQGIFKLLWEALQPVGQAV